MFMALAATVVATFAMAAPTQASFITLVTLVDNSGMAAKGLETTWSNTGGSISNILVLNPQSTATVVGDTIKLTFQNTLPDGGVVAFRFESATAPVGFVSGAWNVLLGRRPATIDVDPTLDVLHFSTTAVAVPEPPAMGLMVIGLSGFLGLRRWVRNAKAARA
jgi:hypothetical protein